jgi:hypothetical protein
MTFRAFATLVFLAGVAAPVIAAAQCAPGVAPYSTPRVVPAPAITGVPSRLRLTAQACATTGLFEATLAGNVLHVRHGSDYDFAHCTSEREVEFSLPALPTGNYLLSYEPEPAISLPCYLWLPAQPFGVAPAPAVSVPAVRGWMPALLMLLLAAVAIPALRRSPRRRK